MNPPRPWLSIVIPSYNRPDLLARCLGSVVRHAPNNTEVIVVDDGSPGATVSETASRFAGVHTVRHAKNQGFCVAANRGLRLARGDVVELLNDDAFVTEGWAEPALRAFDDPTVGAVAPLVLMADRDVIDSAGDEYDEGGFARKRGHGCRPGVEHLRRREVFGASGSSAFYRRSAFERVGHFPEEFGSYFEDVDLAWRLNKAGYRTIYEPESVVRHGVGCSHGTRRRRLLLTQSRNEERVYLRHVSGKRGRHAAVLAGKALRRIREGDLTPWLFGRLGAWLELLKAPALRSSGTAN